MTAMPAIPGTRTAQADGIRQVQDPRDRFTINIPVTWEVRTSAREPSVEAISPAPETGLPDSLQVITRDIVMSLSPEACIAKAEWLMHVARVDFKTIEKHPETIAGLQAFTHEYTWRTRSGVERRSYQVCLALSHRVFVLIGSTTDIPASARAHLEAIGRIIETFRPKSVPDDGTPLPQRPRGSRDR
jgi:hypothetical protein